MPELPEVETIKRQIRKTLIGKKIKSVEVRLPKLIKGISAFEFKKKVEGVNIKDINRRAKVLIINLSNGFSLIIHLKLTGQLIYREAGNRKQKTRNKKQEAGKHTHIIYYFTNNSALMHNDLRQFGYVKLIPTEKIDKFLEEKEKFGPEPLDKKFTLKEFQKILVKKQSQRIKPLLMDQTFISGIGNLYSDEILFYAKVRPLRIVSSLKPEEIKKIYQAIKKILPEAIKFRGSSVDTYVDIKGKQGKYITKLKVYGKNGRPCLRCKTKIERLKISGRSAHFCPKCQK